MVWSLPAGLFLVWLFPRVTMAAEGLVAAARGGIPARNKTPGRYCRTALPSMVTAAAVYTDMDCLPHSGTTMFYPLVQG